jgi:hypothetical protein
MSSIAFDQFVVRTASLSNMPPQQAPPIRRKHVRAHPCRLKISFVKPHGTVCGLLVPLGAIWQQLEVSAALLGRPEAFWVLQGSWVLLRHFGALLKPQSSIGLHPIQQNEARPRLELEVPEWFRL